MKNKSKQEIIELALFLVTATAITGFFLIGLL